MVLSVVIMLGCDGRSSKGGVGRESEPDSILAHDSFQPQLLNPRTAFVYQAIGAGARIAVGSGAVWVGDADGDPFIHILRLGGDPVTRSVGRQGEGPGEFQSAAAISFRRDDSTAAWVFDVSQQRLTRVGRDFGSSPRIIAPRASGVVRAAWLGTAHLVGLVRGDTVRYVTFDDHGAAERSLPVPLLGSGQVSSSARIAQTANGFLCTSPDGGMFAFAFAFAGRVDLVSAASNRILKARVPYPTDGQFERDSRTGKWHQVTLRNYYEDCAASDRFVYALFSGRVGSPQYGLTAYNGVFVHVFDWTGRLARVLKLGHEASSIAVLGDSLLYASTWQSDTVWSYNLQ